MLIASICLFSYITVNAEGIEEYLNNVVAPDKQYDTYLSAPYLRTITTEENINHRNGDLSISQTDYILPGRNGLDLEIRRIYKSSAASMGNMKVKYVDGAWVDYTDKDIDTSGFYEKRYNLGVGMRFSFETLEINDKDNKTILFHTDTGDVYTLREYLIDDNDKKEWFKNGIESTLSNTDKIFLPRGDNAKEVYLAYSNHYTYNGETSKYVLVKKNGMKIYFTEDGRILAKIDKFNNSIKFKYTTIKYNNNSKEITRKLISEITDTIDRTVKITYEEDHNYKVQNISTNNKKDKSYKEMQNPNTVDSGDLQGKYRVVVTLPNNEKLIYDKSAALVNDKKEVLRTRLQTVYDIDNKAKYHYWYEQPSLGFTFNNGTSYSVYNRYEYLVQVDYCKTNELRKYTYESFKKKLYKGSMEYRKIFKREKSIKLSYNSATKEFLDRFNLEEKEKETFKYNNEPDGYGKTEYKPGNYNYLKDTYRYNVEITDLLNNKLIKTYDGLHELITTEKLGKDHKEVITTSHDQLKLINKKTVKKYSMKDGNIVDGPIIEIENYKYDKYGNLINYTGLEANRNDEGEPIDDEHTVTYVYDYDKYHSLKLKTLKQDINNTQQIENILDDKGNVTRTINKLDGQNIIKEYVYDKYGNITQEKDITDDDTYAVYYEYGVDAKSNDYKGAYLTKKYVIVDGAKHENTYAYDNKGQLIYLKDANDNITTHQYDVLGRVTIDTFPDNSTIEYTYEENPFNNMSITVKDKKGTRFKHIYDINGKELETSYYINNQWKKLISNEYDTYSRKIQTIDGNNNKITYEYLSNNKLFKKTFYEGNTPKDFVKFQYKINKDTNQYETLMTDEDGYIQKLYYDINNNLIKVEATPDNKTYNSKTNTYDYVGNKITATDYKGNETKYIYDKAGRLIKTVDPLGNETNLSYNTANLLIKKVEPDNKITTYKYNEKKQLIEEKTYLDNSTEKFYSTFKYDNVGNLIEKVVGKEKDVNKEISSKITYKYNNINQITDEIHQINATDTNLLQYEYDKNGNKIAEKNYITKDKTKYFMNSYQYDILDNLIEERHKLVENSNINQESINKYTYDNENNILSRSKLTEHGYITENYTYDYKNRISKKTMLQDEDTNITITYTYDNRGNTIANKIADLNNEYITTYRFDGLNNKISSTDPIGNITRYQYDENNNLIKTVDARYISYNINDAPGIINTYDNNNRLTTTSILEEDETKVINHLQYDGRGNITKKITSLGYNNQDPSNSIGDTYTYNAINQVETKKTAENISNNIKTPYRYIYNGNGLLIEEIDPKGNNKQIQYDLDGKLIKITNKDKTTITNKYDLTGRRNQETTDEKGNTITIKHNIYGSEDQKQLPDNSIVTFTYTEDGKLKEQNYSTGEKTIYNYDYIGNIKEQKNLVDKSATEEIFKQTINTYDIRNLPITTTIYKLTKNKTTNTETQSDIKYQYTYTYDKAGNKTKIQQPENKETLISYDKVGNIITTKKKIAQNKYQITRNKYNLQNMITEKSLLLDTEYLDKKSLSEGEFDEQYGSKILSTIKFKYDPQGNIKETKDQLGNKTTYTYNLSSKLKEVTNPLGNKITYNYDELDNLIKETRPLNNITSYQYDSMGRITSKISTYQDDSTKTISYEYDEKGQLTKQINPEQQISKKGINYTYDNMGRNTEIYDVRGNLIQKNTYNQQGQLIKKEEGTNIGKNKAYNYTYDLVGNIKTITDPLNNTTTFNYDILGNLQQKQDAKNNTTTYTYNKDNTLKQVDYEEEITNTFTYDELGRIITKQDGLGNITTYQYNNFNKIVKETDALGNTKKIKYDLKGQVVETIDQIGTKTTIIYNSVGQIIKREIPLVKEQTNTIYYVEDYVYDEENKLLSKTTYEKQTQKDLRNITYTYYKDGKIKTRTTTAGETTKYTYDKNSNTISQITTFKEGSKQIQENIYDENNRLITKTNYIDKKAIKGNIPSNLIDTRYPDKIKNITKYHYDIQGNITKEELPKAAYYNEKTPQKQQHTITYTYDELNRLTNKTYTNNNTQVTTTSTYDELGNKTQETDEKGKTITYKYTKNNKLKQVTDKKGNTITYQYDKALNRTKQTNQKGQQITYKYDALGRVVQTINTDDIIIQTKKYDQKGNLITTTDALGNETTYTYDLGNRLTTITDPETKQANKQYTTKITHNIYGQKITITNALNQTTKYKYDTIGQLIAVTNESGVTTTYGYNDTGNKISQINGNRKETKYTYSQNGHLLTKTDPLGQTTTYKYDISGNITQEQDKKGQHINYTYDNLNRLTNKTIQETAEEITYQYDLLGNRTKMKDQTGITTYTYDENDQMTTKNKNNKPIIQYTYDEIGNTLTTTVEGRTTTYTYDNQNRMITVTNQGQTTNYTYDIAGRRKTTTYPNQVTISYTYNKNNKITKITNTKGSKQLSTITYTYDLVGRKTTKQNHLGTTNYTYDKEGRLTKEIAPGYTKTYRYDSNGNRIIQNNYYKQPQNTSFIQTTNKKKVTYKTKKTYNIYNENNQLIRTTEKMYDEAEKEVLCKKTTMKYDNNGNQTSTYATYYHPHTITMKQKIDAVAVKEEQEQISTLINRTTKQYDGYNRLTKTQKIQDGQKSIITYTYNGDDLRTSKTTKTSKNNYQEKTTYYTYDKQYVILEKNQENQVTHYIRGLNYIAKQEEQISYYLYNGHGDVIQTVDEQGNIQNQYTYDAFGNEELTHETTSNAIRYAGEFYDEEVGLYYLRARYYDPSIGRFISEDSYWGEEENPASLNLYTYCSNDPVNYIDPSGHWQQGDDKLTKYAQTRIKYFTKRYYEAKTQSEKNAWHKLADMYRNNSKYKAGSSSYHKPNNGSTSISRPSYRPTPVKPSAPKPKPPTPENVENSVGQSADITVGDKEVGNGAVSNGTTTGNLRDIAEGLGGTVNWNGSNRTATVVINGNMITYDLKKMKNGIGYASDGTKFFLNGGRIQVGVRQVAEKAGAKVSWKPKSSGGVTVKVDYIHASVSKNIKVIKDNGKQGEIWTSDNDKIIVFEQRGNKSHVRYPVGNNYATAWVDTNKLHISGTPTPTGSQIDSNKPNLMAELEGTNQIDMNNDSFILPIDSSTYKGVKVTSFFGYRILPHNIKKKKTTSHSGWDFGTTDTGTINISSIGIGKVEEISDNPNDRNFGRYIIISYLYKRKTVYIRYAHLQKSDVTSGLAKGDTVKQGQQIGVMGSSMKSSETGTDKHLHISAYDTNSYSSKNSFDMFSGLTLKGELSTFSQGIYDLGGNKATQQWFDEKGYIEDKVQPSFKRAKKTNDLYNLYDYDEFFGN
jgi:RHS repeat-associated protein